MKVFDLLDGRDENRQRLYCLVRQQYGNRPYKALSTELITKILELSEKHHTSINLRFNSNLLNPLYFELDGYAIFYSEKVNATTLRNWGNHKQFLLDLLNELGLIVKVSFEDGECDTKMYVLGKDGEIIKEYISEEFEV